MRNTRIVAAFAFVIAAAAVLPLCAADAGSDAAVLSYLGHACFTMTAPDGTIVVIDPYGTNKPVGLAAFPGNLAVDAAVVSHSHPDHAGGVLKLKGKPDLRIINKPGSYDVGPFKITGYESDHGVVNGVPQGTNVVFVFEIGGVKVVHLGGAGLITQAPILEAVKSADLAIVDMGEDSGHPIDKMMEQLVALGVNTLIPVHYSLSASSRYYGAPTLEEALLKAPAGLPVQRQGSTIGISAGMPSQILCMTPSLLQVK